MDIMTHAKFHFNRLMLTLIFGIRASELPPPSKKLQKFLQIYETSDLYNICSILVVVPPKRCKMCKIQFLGCMY